MFISGRGDGFSYAPGCPFCSTGGTWQYSCHCRPAPPGTFGDDIAVGIDAGIDGGLGRAVADGLDLLNGVRQLHQTHGAREELGLEVGPEAKAHDGHVKIIHNGPELVDLIRSQKLGLVHDHRVAAAGKTFLIALVNIHIGAGNFHFRLKADAASENVHAVPGIRAGLQEPDVHVIFFVIIFGDQGLCRFAGTHGTIFEIKLGHLDSPLKFSVYFTKHPAIMQAHKKEPVVKCYLSLRTSPQTGVAIRISQFERYGFSRQCAHWLRMTGVASILQQALFFSCSSAVVCDTGGCRAGNSGPSCAAAPDGCPAR